MNPRESETNLDDLRTVSGSRLAVFNELGTVYETDRGATYMSKRIVHPTRRSLLVFRCDRPALLYKSDESMDRQSPKNISEPVRSPLAF